MYTYMHLCSSVQLNPYMPFTESLCMQVILAGGCEFFSSLERGHQEELSLAALALAVISHMFKASWLWS